MRQLYFKDLVPKGTKVKESRSVILTERDINIINFILDMKFASIENIFSKFFAITLSGVPAKTNEWTVRRLQQLAKAGYVVGIHSFSERTKYYLATPKGYRAVASAKPEALVLRPSSAIDHHTFSHDKLVLEARIVLENRRAATSWVSDKKLRSAKELAGGLLDANVPDGIFTDQFGVRYAFEMEVSGKMIADYRRKIQKYVLMMRSESSQLKVFDKVLYVYCKPWVGKNITELVRIYGDLFEVKSLSEFYEECCPVGGS